MESDLRKNSESYVRLLGGSGNIVSVTNCMTRLRVTVKDDDLVDLDPLKDAGDVLGVVHDRASSYEIVVGPGKSKRYADEVRSLSSESNGDAENSGAGRASSSGEGTHDKKALPAQKQGKGKRVKAALKVIGDIFVPLIPGIITAGLCAGFASLITQLVPDYENIKMWSIVYNVLDLIRASFMTYITAWAGYRAAERFGATPIIGGMLGMITSLDGIDTISKLLGLYNDDAPLESILRNGRGGVLAVIAGVFLLSIIEKNIRKRMPQSVDVIFTPLLSLLILAVPYILVIMPLLGFVSSSIVWVFSQLCLSESIYVRIFAGFVSAALFLPLVAAGMHHGLVALYSVQLQEIGYITLYPALAMAGAGQVGASIALWIKAKRVNNKKLCSVIAGALPAGFLGIGEPLIYGVTLPLGKPFITAGIGAGFGGALVMAMEVGSTTWGPSGLLGMFVMTDGPCGAVKSVIVYLIGLLISYVCSFIITALTYDERNLITEPETTGLDYPSVKAGETITIGSEVENAGEETGKPFEYRLTDPVGIHARPAGKLAELAKSFDSDIKVKANGKTVSAKSVIDLMSLGASQGALLSVSAEGKDAEEALKAIKKFLEDTL